VSVLVLIVTILYWSDFTARRIPVLWLVTYTADPIATALTFVSWKMWRAGQPGRHPLTSLFLVEASVLGALGAFSLLAPDLAVAVWPWKITPLLAQVYGAFFLTFASGGLLASRERRPMAIRPVAASAFALAVLVLVGSAFHLDRFAPGLPTLLWFGGFAIAAIAFALALVHLQAHPREWVARRGAEAG
jgi:hypothetical protein